jgi:hypothetical protein
MGYAQRVAEVGQRVTCEPSVEVDDLVCLSSTNVASKALADSESTMPAVGIVIRKISSTVCIINQYKLESNLSGLTPKQRFFVSTTDAGKMQTNVPQPNTGHILQCVAEAKSSTERLITIDATNYVVRG